MIGDALLVGLTLRLVSTASLCLECGHRCWKIDGKIEDGWKILGGNQRWKVEIEPPEAELGPFSGAWEDEKKYLGA